MLRNNPEIMEILNRIDDGKRLEKAELLRLLECDRRRHLSQREIARLVWLHIHHRSSQSLGSPFHS